VSREMKNSGSDMISTVSPGRFAINEHSG